MSVLSSNLKNELTVKNSSSFGESLEKKNRCCSEQKLVSCSMCSSNEKNYGDNPINFASNSYSVSESNELFQSFIDSNNNKNKELSLLYLINTFGKSYSSESEDKNKIVIDLPKISKNLFSKPHVKSCSSKNLDNFSFQKNLPLKKCYSKGGIMNSFFSSIYERQISSSKLVGIEFSDNKSDPKKDLFFLSGNKKDKADISPFIKGNYKFGTLFNDNNGNDIDNKNVILMNNNNKIKNKLFNTSLHTIAFGDECTGNKIEES